MLFRSQTLNTYMFYQHFEIEGDSTPITNIQQGDIQEEGGSGLQPIEDTTKPVVGSGIDQELVTDTQEPYSQRLDDTT